MTEIKGFVFLFVYFFQNAHLNGVVEQREEVGHQAGVVGAAVGQAEQPVAQHLQQADAYRRLRVAHELWDGGGRGDGGVSRPS